MSMQRSLRLSLASAIALALLGSASLAAAQTPPAPPPATTMPTTPPPAQPAMQPASTMATQPTDSSSAFYRGTETTATYPLPNSHGGTLTVRAGMPADVPTYGPPPSFKTLDTNHDGRISEAEASAYPPLDNDFLYASHGAKSISHAGYQAWVKGLQ